ncbi:alpha-internexin-like protein [Lates japonicus]|uniref:Alpha-internexin-like protein n=1 Tax=Lates japonicus TaxID=270547 RepID=A0AAD3R9P8_LATJO|nr:alpha-internexin-like protein [Lates japonicus]
MPETISKISSCSGSVRGLKLIPWDNRSAAASDNAAGEETRIGTGITYPSPSISAGVGQGYNYQSRIYTSSGKSTKKEGKDEDQQQQQSKSGAKVSQREVYEETVVTTKKMEKQQDPNDIPTNQKN